MSCEYGKATFRSDHTCTFCGSLDPDFLMEHITNGSAVLRATDKNYKLYVELPEEEPNRLRIIGHAWNVATDPTPPGGGDWVEIIRFSNGYATVIY